MNINRILIAAACLYFAPPAGALLATPPKAPPLQTGTITGHVRDTSGKPLAYIPVEIMQTGEFAVTDKDGAYTLAEEDPGAYTLTAKGTIFQAVTKRTQVPFYSQAVVSFTLAPAGHAVFDFTLKPLGTKWVSPQPSPILHEYSGPGRAWQSSPEDAFRSSVFGGDSGLHSTARSR